MTSRASRQFRVALLHLAPRPGDLAHNRLLIERSILKAAEAGANWVITPELAVCGYTFVPTIGIDWISPQPDAWMLRVCNLAARLRVHIFLSLPEKDERTTKLHNATFVIGSDGEIRGKHRKINTLRVGSEAWSSPGSSVTPVSIEPNCSVGVLICADAYSATIPIELQAKGAQFLVSPAAWRPGEYGPNGEWERSTIDTDLPLFVCNRTGPDVTMNFAEAESVVVHGGKRHVSLKSEKSIAFVFTWIVATQSIATEGVRTIELE